MTVMEWQAPTLADYRRQVELTETAMKADVSGVPIVDLARLAGVTPPVGAELVLRSRIVAHLCATRSCLCEDARASQKRFLEFCREQVCKLENGQAVEVLAPGSLSTTVTPPAPITAANVLATIDLLERTIALLQEKGMAGASPLKIDHPAVALIVEFWGGQPPEVQVAVLPYSTLDIADELTRGGQLATLMREAPSLADVYRAFIAHARLKLLELEFVA